MTATLMTLSEDLTAHMDSLDMTEPGTPERRECEVAIQKYMELLPVKVDAVASFLTHLESQAQLAAQEIKRLQIRKTRIDALYERLADYVVRVLEKLPDPKRGSKKLEGETSTL